MNTDENRMSPDSTTFPNGVTWSFDGDVTITVDVSPIHGRPESWAFKTHRDAAIAWLAVLTH